MHYNSITIFLILIKVGVDEVSAVYFPIIPRKIGLVDIKVQAQTDIMADAVHKKLLVEVSSCFDYKQSWNFKT